MDFSIQTLKRGDVGRGIEEGLLRAKRTENFCDDALKISLKYVSENFSSSHYATFKKINADKKIKKRKIWGLLCYY